MQPARRKAQLCQLPRLSQRDPSFALKVIEGMKGPFVDNVVTKCTIQITGSPDEPPSAPFNIHDLAWRLAGKHDPKKFRASTSIRLHEDPSSTYLMFPSQKMVMTGVRCPELLLAAASRITRFYSQTYHRLCRIVAYQVNNVHGVIDMGHPLDLDAIHRALPQSYRQPSNIKCVIFKISVPYKPPRPDPPAPPMSHLLWPVEDPLSQAPSAAVVEPAKKRVDTQPRKRRRGAQGAVFADEVRAEEELGDMLEFEKPQPRSVYTTATVEVFTRPRKAGAKAATRKKPKDPNHVAVNVWESGRVCILGRTEEHLCDAAIQLAAFLAQFTMTS